MLLRNCIRSIHENASDSKSEIIVIDNHSADESPDMIHREFPDIKLLKNPENFGFSRACNQGFRISGGEFLLFLNSDTVVRNGAIQKMTDYMRVNPDVGVLGPKILNSVLQPTRSYMRFLDLGKLFLGSKHLRFFLDVEKYRIHYANYDYITTRTVQWVSGACLMIRRDLFSELGMFDENYFFYFEDMDLCHKAGRAGFKVVYFPEAEIIHLFGGSTSSNSAMNEKYYRQSLLYYLRKNTNFFSYQLAKSYFHLRDLYWGILARMHQSSNRELR